MEPVLSQTIYPEFTWQAVVLVVSLITIGVMLLGMEIFVTPGFGVVGGVGLIFLLGGMISSWVIVGPTWGSLVAVGTCAFSTALFILGLKAKGVKKRMILSTKQCSGGGTGAEDMIGLVGKEGTAVSDLRPAGIASVCDKRVDVVSDGDFIDSGVKIKVISVDGARIVVTRS